MNDLENLLKKDDLDTLNKRSILQHNVINIPRDSSLTQSKYDRAEGNAQLIDFIKMVGLIVESVYADSDIKVTYMPKSKAYFLIEDADERFTNPIITFKIMQREIKEGTGKKPQMKESFFENDDDRSVIVYQQSFSSIIRFQFLSLEYNTAYNIMDNFEDMLIEYSSEIKKKGIVNFYLLKQNEDNYYIDNRDKIDELTLDYYVETQKNKVIFRENAKTLILDGEVTDEEFNSIPTNPYYKKNN